MHKPYNVIKNPPSAGYSFFSTLKNNLNKGIFLWGLRIADEPKKLLTKSKKTLLKSIEILPPSP